MLDEMLRWFGHPCRCVDRGIFIPLVNLEVFKVLARGAFFVDETSIQVSGLLSSHPSLIFSL